jgi:PAS domain S-box-containing protein
VANSVDKTMERQAAEEGLREATVRLQAIVDTAADGIITFDSAGTVDSFSSAAESLFGYTRSEVLGKNVSMLMSDTDGSQTEPGVESHAQGGPQKVIGTAGEVRGRRHDGTIFPMELRIGESHLDDRQLFTAIVRDITACKTAVEERTRLLAELEAERARLKDAQERKDQFLDLLAHELRNPLAPISNAVQIIKLEGFAGPNFHWSVEVIQSQVKLMTRLIDDLLDVSRITRGKIVLRLEPVELREVFEQAIEASQPLIQENHHRFTVELPEFPVILRADTARLARALSNLLNNAAKYTDPGGEIALAAEVIGQVVEIRVRDNGIGLLPEFLPKVFDIFAHASQQPSRAPAGLGIGLAVVRSLVEQHGGKIIARSEGQRKGSEFVVRLPLDKAPGGRDAAATAEQN